MLPFVGFSNPRRSLTRVDFPHPVFPTIATYCPGFILRERSSMMMGEFSLYLKVRLMSSIAPEILVRVSLFSDISAKKAPAKKASAKAAVVYVNAENAGFKAGDVYQALAAAEKALTVAEVAKKAKVALVWNVVQ